MVESHTKKKEKTYNIRQPQTKLYLKSSNATTRHFFLSMLSRKTETCNREIFYQKLPS